MSLKHLKTLGDLNRKACLDVCGVGNCPHEVAIRNGPTPAFATDWPSLNVHASLLLWMTSL
jgi:hypothetical protein